MEWDALTGAAGAVRSLLRRVQGALGTTTGETRFGDHERIEESKFHTGGVAEPLLLETGELPDLGEDTRVVLMAVDPYLVHAYWNVAPGKIEAARALLADAEREAKPVLRFHDMTGIELSFDVEIDLRAGNWYVRLWSPEKRYCVDLGLLGKDGRFSALARSNVVQTPPAWPQVKAEEAALLVEPASPRNETASPAPAAEAPAAASEISAPRPAGAGAVLSERLAEMAALRGQPLPEPREPALPRRPAPAGEEPCSDLTEMSERKFSAGTSSGLLGSR